MPFSFSFSHYLWGKDIFNKNNKNPFSLPESQTYPLCCQENALPMSYTPRLKEKLWKSLIVRAF